MRRLAHLSDLHFGAVRPEAIAPLLTTLSEMAPDIVVVSGDLTQRAKRSQFESARAFLDQIPCPAQIVVPGNHDIPMYNPWLRFLGPRRRFDRTITGDPFPTLCDEEVAIVGVNTARSLAISNGRINSRQLAEIARRLRQAHPRALRIVVAHHPFVVPEGIPVRQRAGRADSALAALLEHRIDLLLTGHRHAAWVSPLGTSVPTVHAGTTISSRTRDGTNSFHEILVDRALVTVRRLEWHPDEHRFVPVAGPAHEFLRDPAGRLEWTIPLPKVRGPSRHSVAI